MREVAAERERPVLLFSGGKDSIVLLRLAEKAFRPAQVPVPGHARRHGAQLPRGDRVPRPPRAGARRAPRRRERAGVDRQGPRRRSRPARAPRATSCRRRRCSTRSRSTASTPRWAARAATRSAPARRSASSASATTSASGTRARSGPSSGTSTTRRIRKGEQIRVFPISNWTELDVWQYVAREQLELPSIYFAHEREVFRRDGMLYAVSDFVERLSRRGAVHRVGSLPHGRRHDVHRRRRQRRGDDRRGRHRDRRDPRHRARRDPRRRPRLARPRWKTGSALATSKEFARQPELLRLVTAGSVDDGKSTLIGRLLYDTKQILADQLEHIEDASRRRGDDYVDLALLTDGLRAEREQGITIDVAYRSFVTPRRRFQLADAPGHVQYTRNMVTGASTADVAVILVDARKGVIEQTRRHSYIVGMLALPHVVFAVNKMDLVDFSEERFDEIARELAELGSQLDIRDATRDPAVRAQGRQRRRPRPTRCPGTTGPTLLEHLETIELDGDRNLAGPALPGAVGDPADGRRAPRLPRLRGPGRGRRLAGRRRGRRAAVGPAQPRRRDRQRRRPARGGDPARVGDDPARGRHRRLPRRHARRSRSAPPVVARELTARVCWMAERPLEDRARLLVKHTTRTVPARVEELVSRRRHPHARGPPEPRADGAERPRRRALPARRAARRRPVRAQPRHRRVHPDRRVDERHGRRRHGARRSRA